MTLAADTKLGRYEIRSKIGEGGMGEVYLAEDIQLGRQVAMKFLPAELKADEQANRRLMQEARAAATLDHPNICAVSGVSEAEGRSFIVMQYLEGKTLEARIRSKLLELNDSIAIQGEATVREVLLAQQLNPNVGHGELAYLFLHLGLEELGAREIKRGFEIDPTSEFVKHMSLLVYELKAQTERYRQEFGEGETR